MKKKRTTTKSKCVRVKVKAHTIGTHRVKAHNRKCPVKRRRK